MFHRHPAPVAAAVPLAALTVLLAGLAPSAAAQAPERGPRHVDPRWHALVHATLVPAPGERVEDATIVLRDGLVVSVESGAAPPAGARVHDCSGLHVYAGLIEPYVEVEAPRPEEQDAHWNPLVMPQRRALDGEGPSAADRETLRSLGFTAACLSPRGGVLRGSSALVALGEPESVTANATPELLAPAPYQTFAFETAPSTWSPGGPNRAGDPSSEMGSIALLRQTFSDAVWQAQCLDAYRLNPTGGEPPRIDDALEALGTPSTGLRLLFDARNELQSLRAIRLAAEFSRPLMILGSGTEYRRLDVLRDSKAPVLCTLAFPETPRVDTLARAERVSLLELMGWEQAPANPRRLVDAGVVTVLTTAKLEDRGKEFWPNLRKAIANGLSEEDALAMLTTRTARLLGVGADGGLGRVAPGFQAHLLVTDGELFAEDTKIRDVWVGGRRYEVTEAPAPDRSGDWAGSLAASEPIDAALTLSEKEVALASGETELETRGLERDGDRLHFLFEGDALGSPGTWSFSGRFEGDSLHGTCIDPDGTLVAAQFTRSPQDDSAGGDSSGDGATGDEQPSEGADEPGDTEPSVAGVPEQWPTPFGAYGFRKLPPQQTVLLVHATVWTSGPDGILEDGAVLVEDGRIRYVGPSESAPEVEGARVLDLMGKHVTPGLIDCHSHTGISGAVNEMGQRVTAEVRVADVIDPDDVNWYRQLAGGLTAANQLHGSGNAIGGQNSVVKLRWGVPHPDGMRFAGAKPGIKFALGENPKRVAQDTRVPDEYPQTRMGVATLINDRLLAGREYRAVMEQYQALSSLERARTMPPRRDLELEALGEVVAGERLVHCHSYRQDEILMLCRTAENFGFKIGTFQHVLEGYKVADAIAEAAIGASTFADWWAYKFEVIDAIPGNAGLMHDVGVVASINSDSADHARRLNTEAAKSVRYANLSPAEALELVTINPAIQLEIDDRVGSIEEGKDADLAVWSGDPLSYRSRCERTFVDGRELFSIERDDELRREARSERQRIIQKILAEGRPDVVAEAAGQDDDADGGDRPGAADREWEEELLRAGLAPGTTFPGECGCTQRTLDTER